MIELGLDGVQSFPVDVERQDDVVKHMLEAIEALLDRS